MNDFPWNVSRHILISIWHDLHLVVPWAIASFVCLYISFHFYPWVIVILPYFLVFCSVVVLVNAILVPLWLLATRRYTSQQATDLARRKGDDAIHSLMTLGFVVLLPLWLMVISVYFVGVIGLKAIVGTPTSTFTRFRNSAAYSSSKLGHGEIRLLKILPGKLHDTIQCQLFTRKSENSRYEALSYTWGSGYRQHRVSVDGLPFFVGVNLYSALLHLRDPQDERTIWIDAICINQEDVPERESQVKQMRKIYQRASTVMIWLGKPRGQHLDLGTEYVKRIARAEDTDVSAIWQESTKWQQAVDELLQAPWWDRAWVVQEAFLAQHAVVQCGYHLIQFDDLCKFITNPAVTGRLPGLQSFAVFNLATTVQGLRNAVGDPRYVMLDLAHKFRHRIATDPRDKLYAFMGLLDNEKDQLIPIDYSKGDEAVFQDFAKASINRYGNLLVVALAADHSSNTSWSGLWGLHTDTTGILNQYWPDLPMLTGFDNTIPFWRGGLDDRRWYPLQVPEKYLAAGGHPAMCTTDLADPAMISVKGFTYDTVAVVGVKPLMKFFTSWWIILDMWEALAFQSSSAPEQVKRVAFDRTITANIPGAPVPNWRDWAPRTRTSGVSEKVKPNKPQEATIQDIMELACGNRRFLVTKNGTFGLGPSDTKVGDPVCVLLGSEIPFILERVERSSLRFYRRKTISNEPGVLHKVRGQAYVDGAMIYKGDMKQDIIEGKIKLEEYLLI